MPIQFQCQTCFAKLGIGSRKAGMVISCPKCKSLVKVPLDSRPSAPLSQTSSRDIEDSDSVDLLLNVPWNESDRNHEDRSKDPEMAVANCPMCQTEFLIGGHQIGTRIRCGKCSFDFVAVARPPSTVQGTKATPPPVARANARTPTMTGNAANPASPMNPPAPTTPLDNLPASNPRRAKATAHHNLPATLVFQALVQAIRSFQTTVLEMRQADFHVRFAFVVQGIETVHNANVFDILNQQCDVELVSVDVKPENSFEMHYDAIFADLAKYLKFATPGFDSRQRETPTNRQRDDRWDEGSPVICQRAAIDDERRDYDDRSERDIERYRERDYDHYEPEYSRRQKSTEGGGLAIAGFVCGVVSLVLFCVPYVGIPAGILGIVFSACDLGSKYKGLAIAGFVCAVVGIALYILLIVVAGVVIWGHH
jgi:predicted Zn finger-like uncharacterized protein